MNELPFKLGVTLHSFANEYCSLQWSLDDLMFMTKDLGGGLEIVGPSHQRGFPFVTDEYEATFKSAVNRYGLTPTSYGSYADPYMLPNRDLTPDELVDYTLPQIHGAKRLGFPIVRLQHFTAEVIERLLPTAERLGIKLGWELHVPMTLEDARTHFLFSLVEKHQSEFLGIIPDAGIFANNVSPLHIAEGIASGVSPEVADLVKASWYENISLEEVLLRAGSPEPQSVTGSWIGYVWDSFGHSDPAGMLEIMDWIIHFHGKFFEIENGIEPNLRYQEIVATLIDGGYQGWLSSEFEGATPNSFVTLQQHQAMIRGFAETHMKAALK